MKSKSRLIPIFSVVILTYNAEKTIKDCIVKISTALNKFRYEIIVIDSESGDQTVPIIETLKHTISVRIINVLKKKFSFSNTRNLSIKIATGKYVCFVSGDAILAEKQSFKYFIDDFELSSKVVAVFGNQISNKNTSEFQKMEFVCRFGELDYQANKEGVFLQHKYVRELLPDSKYYLFNTFSCFKRSFLIKHPFPQVEAYEDFALGKYIIDNGYSKVYDRRCSVYHSHTLNSFSYIKKQIEDIRWGRQYRARTSNKIICKILRIISSDKSLPQKIVLFIIMSYYYLLKCVALFIIFAYKLVRKSI